MRKPLEGAKRISGPYPYYGASGIVDYVDGYLFDEELILLSEDGANITDRNYPVCFLASGKYWVNNHAHVLRTKQGNENNFICNSLERKDYTQYNTGMAMPKLNKETCKKIPILCPGFEEQKKIGDYFRSLDNLITLHHRKYINGKKEELLAWEQRKLNEIADKVSEKNKNNEFSEPFTNSAEQGIIRQKDYFDREIVNNENLNGYYIVRNDDFIYNPRISATAPVGPINRNRLGRNGVMSPLYTVFRTHDIDNLYLEFYFKTTKWHRFMKLNGDSGARFDRFTISSTQFMEMPIPYPTLEEQQKIGEYFESLDTLITLHQHKQNNLKNILKYIEITLIITKEAAKMPELEKIIEEKLIDQLIYGDSQWTYRKDLKTEEDLWKNFKYILEQNNKDRLNGESLSESEFEQVKNQLQFSSFYKAGEWLVGENGKVQVHVQRDTERLHLVVMNHEQWRSI